MNRQDRGPEIVHRRADRWFLLALVASGMLAAAFGLEMVLQRGGIDLTARIDDIGRALIALASAVACGVAAWRQHGRHRVAWSLLGAGALVSTAGAGVVAFYELRLDQPVPFPSLADAGYLGFVPLALAGVLLFIAVRRDLSARLTLTLDGAFIAGCILAVSWAVVLATVYQARPDGIAGLVSLAHPLADVLILTTILLLVGRPPRSGLVPLWLLAGGLTAIALADCESAYLATLQDSGRYRPVDAGEVAGFLMLGLAAIRAAQLPTLRVLAAEWSRTGWRLLGLSVPVAAAAGVYAYGLVTGSLDAFLRWDLLVIVVLLGLRQLVALVESAWLRLQLETQTTALREREEHLRSLVQNSSDAVTLADRDGVIQFQSGSVQRIFAYAPTEWVGRSLAELVHPADRADLLGALADALKASAHPVSVDCRIGHKLGTWSPCEITITNLLYLPSVKSLVVNIRDVTDRKQLEDKVTHQALHDGLTNLVNRPAFHQQLDEAMGTPVDGRGLAVLFLDLDDFKALNETLGHQAGDELLAAVGARLQQQARPDDVVARLGSDEFAILLRHTLDGEVAPIVAQRILQHFKTPFRILDEDVQVGVSIGIAEAITGHEDADELSKNADLALLMAKSRGKARFERYEPSLRASVAVRAELEVELRRALQRHEFVLHYQPAVMLGSGNILTIEALVRWNHPARGLLTPDDFMPLAEESGLVVPLGRWVLEQACRDGRRWQLAFPSSHPICVSVNMSRRELRETGVLTAVMDASKAAGLAADTLVLELSEGASIDDAETLAKLHELHQRGVKLTLDDFGTGSASLASLRDLPVDFVKLDHSFVARMASSATDAAVVASVVALGNTLNLVTVADGIERADQLAALKAMGCRAGQGYYLCRPLPANEIETLLARCVEGVHGRQMPVGWLVSA
jgi:diguanylate cyclase (GGDEF)-like protein/PAS domain S-box-containing protein